MGVCGSTRHVEWGTCWFHANGLFHWPCSPKGSTPAFHQCPQWSQVVFLRFRAAHSYSSSHQYCHQLRTAVRGPTKLLLGFITPDSRSSSLLRRWGGTWCQWFVFPIFFLFPPVFFPKYLWEKKRIILIISPSYFLMGDTRRRQHLKDKDLPTRDPFGK